MNELDYLDYRILIENYPNISLFGVKCRPLKDPKTPLHTMLAESREYMKDMYPAFEACCTYLKNRKGCLLEYRISDLKREMENALRGSASDPPEVFVGIIALSLIHLGYKIRRVRGTMDARIEKLPKRGGDKL